VFAEYISSASALETERRRSFSVRTSIVTAKGVAAQFLDSQFDSQMNGLSWTRADEHGRWVVA
jgi:hypothetical protein